MSDVEENKLARRILEDVEHSHGLAMRISVAFQISCEIDLAPKTVHCIVSAWTPHDTI
jgi:hypothetical protein